MTNSGKANEICQLAGYTHDKVQCDIAYRAALEMAEWKDQQFKEYLETRIAQDKKNWIDALDREQEDVALFYGARGQAYESIINELFKEEKK